MTWLARVARYLPVRFFKQQTAFSTMSSSSPPLVAVGDTQVSTGRSCDCCDRYISSIEWYQCYKCRVFDICATTTTTESCYQKYFAGKAQTNNPRVQKLTSCTGKHTVPAGASVVFSVKDHEMGLVSWADQDITDYDINRARMQRFNELKNGAPVESERDVWIIAGQLVTKANAARSDARKQQASTTSQPSDADSGSAAEQKSEDQPPTDAQFDTLARQLLEYNIRSANNRARILTLDGGGVRGYLTLRCIDYIIRQGKPAQVDAHGNEVLPDYKAFMSNFEYIAGTSTGGLLAFSLATGIMDQVKPLYVNPSKLFGTARDNWLHVNPGGAREAKYDGKIIHSTIRNLLDGLYQQYKQNESQHWNTCEEVDAHGKKVTRGDPTFGDYKRARVALGWPDLMLTAHDITNNLFIMANTVEDEHDHRLLYDMLCSTMAAQTYFPPYYSAREDATFADGGTGANDPELCGLHMARTAYKNQQCQFAIMSLGTGIATQCVQSDDAKHNRQANPAGQTVNYINGGLVDWLVTPISGLLITTFFDANRSFTAQISESLAQFSYIKRLRLNFSLNTAPLDDVNFAKDLDKVWNKSADPKLPAIGQSNDLKAAARFYSMYVDAQGKSIS